jgi:hypothetical protein
MKVFPHEPKHLPRARAVIRRESGVYDGWTGFEYFGVIWPFRYWGWRVTCWADVQHRREELFLDQLDRAVRLLDLLMDRAERMGRLARAPVEYWPPGNWKERLPLWVLAGFESIRDDFHTNPRMLDGTPAYWAHFHRRYPVPRKGKGRARRRGQCG